MQTDRQCLGQCVKPKERRTENFQLFEEECEKLWSSRNAKDDGHKSRGNVMFHFDSTSHEQRVEVNGVRPFRRKRHRISR